MYLQTVGGKMKKKRDAVEGCRYVEYGEMKKPFRVVRVWGNKVQTSRKTFIKRYRFVQGYYKLIG
jgi:hypothetical protein